MADLPLTADSQGQLPLPWLAGPLRDTLNQHRGHALLVQGAAGVGALPFALTLAQAWLCESTGDEDHRPGPCGHCGSCRLVRGHLHADLSVLLPESLRRLHAWPLADDKVDGDDSKRKPSRQIRIDEVRALIDWVTKTSARGRGKVVVLHPADALNEVSANALLKTLEEPPLGTRLILTTADAAALLPTVRSRCQRQQLPTPEPAAAAAWLSSQGVQRPEVLLAACSGRPLDALAWAQAGVDAAAWSGLPAALVAGRSAAMAGWPLPKAIDALQMLCHDAMAAATGAAPRYFPADSVPAAGNLAGLAAWSQDLRRVARHDEHAWHEGLLLEALVQRAALALQRTPGVTGHAVPAVRGRLDTLHR